MVLVAATLSRIAPFCSARARLTQYIANMSAAIVRAVEAMPKSQAIAIGTVASLGLTFVSNAMLTSGGETPKTITAEGRAATASYARAQNCNPIFGYSSGK